LYIILWLLYAAVHFIVFSGIIQVSTDILIVDGLIHAFSYGILGILLWSVIRYGNFEALPIFQRIVNHGALAIITLLLWIAVGYYGINAIYGSQVSDIMLPFLPVKGLIGLLIYILVVQQFRLRARIEPEIPELPEEISASENTTENAEVQEEILERVAVKSGSKIHVVLVNDITYLQADGDYVHIFTKDGKFLKEQTMKYFEEHLPQSMFVRVHRSVIVNVESISRIELYEKQNQQLTLKNGEHIKVSQAGYKLLRQKLNL